MTRFFTPASQIFAPGCRVLFGIPSNWRVVHGLRVPYLWEKTGAEILVQDPRTAARIRVSVSLSLTSREERHGWYSGPRRTFGPGIIGVITERPARWEPNYDSRRDGERLLCAPIPHTENGTMLVGIHFNSTALHSKAAAHNLSEYVFHSLQIVPPK